MGGVGIDSITGETHGISGLERALDSLLYGKPGVAKKVPLTKDIVNWTDVPPVPGYDIHTTIDIDMQDIVENELNDVLTMCAAEWGVAVLMEVSTGNIKMCIRDRLWGGDQLASSECGSFFRSDESLDSSQVGELRPVSYTHLDVYKRQQESSRISLL